ncbi:hypothetical protein LHYA1_G003840 [Lachnellula hyalina]|uniref:X-Pro dipeptidyl-peptidase n=1 Tax=Lachnellula hyalina TaxID=1316788 RepID=A0A8H8R3H2_9HELO|nr:uncharacterized protein LHYA1_G003840 [Lachnellula hyalina]TVY26976.1 hypothetical protein LHYA1_G003840 [Lachnellula hyalina]
MRQRIEVIHSDPDQDIRQFIETVSEDLTDIDRFHNISISPKRQARLEEYYKSTLASLKDIPFRHLNQDGKIDYLLIQNFLNRDLRQLGLTAEKNKKSKPLLGFALGIVGLCEDRQNMKKMDGKKAAQEIFEIGKQISETQAKIQAQKIKVDKTSAFRATRTVDELRAHLEEWYGFYNGYDPLFSWWVKEPYGKVKKQLEELPALIKERLVGIDPNDNDAIVGDPIGREGLLADLESEIIPYTPEQLLEIAEEEYVWCELEMKKASHELGYGDEWRNALEHVKNLYVEPGNQPELIHFLAQEATDYVEKHDLVTVPRIAKENWRMFMMSPERQQINPFFLGGTSIIVSYPTDTMDHEAKMMSMRGNNIHFSRSTVFHEMIPGHHLQYHMMARHKPYRQMFFTAFWTEGWALYWEMILWDKKFPESPENRIGMLFWRMHRCARIVFSVKFHLGQMSPQECIDLLVYKVGHERATAEGEVRRSFAGDYSPLYQAGYMLGALQIYALRKEVVDSGKMTEKQFHDRVLQANMMPIELLRALLKEQHITPEFKSSWRFYNGR